MKLIINQAKQIGIYFVQKPYNKEVKLLVHLWIYNKVNWENSNFPVFPAFRPLQLSFLFIKQSLPARGIN